MTATDTTTPRGTLVAVLSAKGGCGATLVAVNLAADSEPVDEAVVLDLDFSKGDVAGYLDVWPQRSVKDALSDMGRVDASVLAGLAVKHGSGLSVLAQPFDLSELVQPHASEVRQLLDHARTQWRRVVADCGSRLDEATLTAAMHADHVLVITTPTVPAMRDARRLLRLLNRLGVTNNRIHLIVNRWPVHSRIALDEIERHLQFPVTTTLPRDDEAAEKADYAGWLLKDIAPRSHLRRELHGLWTQVTGEPEEVEGGRQWRRWRFWTSHRTETP